MTPCSEKEYRDKLLRIVKKEVKQIMEEAVTRKFVHEESSSITSLCAAIDACLSHGLKRRALGLFKTNSTTALLQKVAKNFEPAAKVYHRVVEIENSDPNKRTSSSSDSTGQLKNRLISSPTHTARYLWIRIALFEKVLVSIVDHVVQNSSQYFEKEALVADRVSGEILAALLVGPCALDYSKMKTQDHYWTDPPADELVQRNRLVNPISGATPPTPPITRRPLGLPSRRVAIADSRVVSGSDDQARLAGWSARDYVESLHQNCKSTLLYGKNNVLVQPRENLEPIPGYLSLHQTPAGLVIKWTPNQLMHGSISMNGDQNSSTENSVQDKSQFWEYAMTVNVEDIVYLHCHQQDSGGTAVLVGQDGVQQPPIRFPKGGALLAFLSCLENGLTPYGQLDPPLWTQKGKGKVFPKLKRKNPRASKENCPTKTEDVSNDNESMDYVFRIVSSIDKPESISQEMFDPKTTRTGSYLWKIRNGLKQHHSSSSSCSSTSSKSMSEDGNSISGINSQDTSTGNSTNTSKNVRDIKYQQQQQQNIPTEQSIKTLCDSMRKQIISRAFYGWLAHCRHLRTVRTHLAGLINPTIVSIDKPCDASGGLTKEKWEAFFNEQGQITDHDEIRRLIYFGGCAHEIRKQVWLYLLGHFDFMSTEQERQQRTEELAQHYELTMTEWLAVEAIVKQRDKEIIAANLAKLSSESNNSSEMPLTGPKGNQSESNEVFSDVSDSEDANSENPVNGKKKVKHLDSQESNGQDGQSERVNKLQEQDSEESIAKTESRKSSTNSCLRRQRQISENQNVVITNPSVDLTRNSSKVEMNGDHDQVDQAEDEGSRKGSNDGGLCLEPNGTCISPASSNGGVYSNELLDLFSLNLHRIDKDVQRCDRNYWYFMKKENLEKLRNVMCTYVWEHLDQGYIQGMCDLIAPLLVIFDDEILSYSCFCELMKRMVVNFPHGGAMDTHFANMRSLIQILDNEIFDLMHQNGDYTHFYFCYRWFLLDFKREFMYEDIFHVWEVIWAAKHIASPHFVLFMALALVEYYRDIILENDMDFTDIIKFFNEMAERHDAKALLKISRNLVLQIQTLIENNTN